MEINGVIQSKCFPPDWDTFTVWCLIQYFIKIYFAGENALFTVGEMAVDESIRDNMGQNHIFYDIEFKQSNVENFKTSDNECTEWF